MTDKEITHAARQICADQCDNQDNSDGQLYLSGGWDHTIWMRLVEQGIRHGMVIERAAITAWLRAEGSHYDCIYEEAANDIERSAHIKETT
jgi:hypothetical protein